MAAGLPMKLAAARLKAGEKFQPYCAAALYSFTFVETTRVDAMAVDEYNRLYYNPRILREWSVDQIAWVMLHEAWHRLMDHGKRARAASVTKTTQRIWGLAADATINDMLHCCDDCTLPDNGGITSDSLDLPSNGTVEQYYRMLLDRLQNEDGEGDGEGEGEGDGKSAGGGDGEGEGAGDGADDEDAGGGGAGDESSEQLPKGTDDGSGVDGIEREWDLPSPEECDTPGIDDGDMELIKRDVAKSIKESSQSRGTCPAGFRRWANDLLAPPKVPWQRLLASTLRASLAQVAGCVDYSYMRPSRRAAALGGVVLPAMRRPVPHTAIVIDTSGSMSDRQLSAALSEVNGVLGALGLRDAVSVLACDAACDVAQRVMNASQVALHGGGGTDMRVGIEAARKLRPRADICIVLTDGYTPWPSHPVNDMKLIAGLIGSRTHTPSWLQTVRIDVD